MTILYAVLGAIFNTGNDLVYRRSAVAKPTGEIITFYFFASAASVPLAAIVAVAYTGTLTDGIGELFFGVALGGLSFGAYLALLLSLAHGSASVAVTIFRLNIIPAIILANALQMETINLKRSIAVALCVTSIILLVGGGSQKERRETLRRQLISVCACLLGGAATFCNKIAMTEGYAPSRLLFWRFLTVAVITGMYLSIGKSWHLSRDHAKYAPLSGFFMCAALYIILEALRLGDLSVVMPITQLSFVFLTLISWILLRERVTLRKGIGSALAIAVVILIA